MSFCNIINKLLSPLFKQNEKNTFKYLGENADNITESQLYKAARVFNESDNPKVNELGMHLLDATDPFTGEVDSYKIKSLLNLYKEHFIDKEVSDKLVKDINSKVEEVFNKSGIVNNVNTELHPYDGNSIVSTIEFKDGNKANFTLNANKKLITAYTGNLHNGSGVGSKFYKSLFDLAKQTKYKYQPDDTLTNINTIKLPLNIYKYWKETNYMPLKGGKTKLSSLFKEAIDMVEGRLNISKRYRLGKKLANLSDKEVDELAPKTGSDPYLRLNSTLKVLRDVARKLKEGKPLNAIISISALDAAIKELDNFKEDNSQYK